MLSALPLGLLPCPALPSGPVPRPVLKPDTLYTLPGNCMRYLSVFRPRALPYPSLRPCALLCPQALCNCPAIRPRALPCPQVLCPALPSDPVPCLALRCCALPCHQVLSFPCPRASASRPSSSLMLCYTSGPALSCSAPRPHVYCPVLKPCIRLNVMPLSLIHCLALRPSALLALSCFALPCNQACAVPCHQTLCPTLLSSFVHCITHH